MKDLVLFFAIFLLSIQSSYQCVLTKLLDPVAIERIDRQRRFGGLTVLLLGGHLLVTLPLDAPDLLLVVLRVLDLAASLLAPLALVTRSGPQQVVLATYSGVAEDVDGVFDVFQVSCQDLI